MKFYGQSNDAYNAYLSHLRQLIGFSGAEYSALTNEQRTIVHNNLLLVIKSVYDNTSKPAFLLYDFVALRDACLLLDSNNSQLDTAIGKYVDRQVSYLAGYATLRSTLLQEEFLYWLEHATPKNFPAAKCMCTSHYELCENESIRRNINTTMLLQAAVDNKDLFHYGIGVSNAARLAALYDSGFLYEQSRALLEKICDDIVADIPGHAEFFSRLKESEFGKLFDETNTRKPSLAELEKDKLQELLQQARIQVIKQKNLEKYNERQEATLLEIQKLYNSHVASVEKANELIAAQNALATAANTAAEKALKYEHAARYLEALSERHRAAGSRISQALIGAGPVSNNLKLGVGVSAQNGVSLMANHSITKGNIVIASGSSYFNSVASYNQKVAVATAQAKEQAALRAQQIPLKVREPVMELRQFVQQNAQYLQSFDVPQAQLLNPYTSYDSLLFQGFVPGVTAPSNYGQSLVDKAYNIDRQAQLQQLGTDSSSIKIEPDNSTWNLTVNKLNRVINTAVDKTFTVLTGSSSAHANPVVMPINPVGSAAVPGAISANLPGKPPTFTWRQLGAELKDVGNKMALLSLLIANPASMLYVHQILTTPIHDTKPEDTVLPGGSKVNTDTSIPPTSAQDVAKELGKAEGVSTGPKPEDTTIPGYTAHDGDPLLFMFSDRHGNHLKCKYIFRGDTTTPESVFEQGFNRDGKLNLQFHVETNDGSGFVSTTKSPDIARSEEFVSAGDYVYTIKHQEHGIDINEVLGKASKYPHELEIAVPRHISPHDIMGARRVDQRNKFIGEFIKNPNYKP